ncbi:MAG: hypothetical protein NT041_01945 [Candidatus Vogelbacteria bacterium]|nr:hypothetical protein [Candidatus Vogelbacteria bacterium]
MNERFVYWRNRKILIPSLLLLGAIFLCPQFVQAADLRVVTDRATYNVGDTITANVILASASQSTNAVSGTLNFSTDYLQGLNC